MAAGIKIACALRTRDYAAVCAERDRWKARCEELGSGCDGGGQEEDADELRAENRAPSNRRTPASRSQNHLVAESNA